LVGFKGDREWELRKIHRSFSQDPPPRKKVIFMARKKKLSRDERITNEINRLNHILKDLPKDKIDIADGLVNEAAFMRVTLEDLKEDINKNGTVDEMPQGSYSIMRESPSVKIYNTMVQRYAGTCKEIFNLLPKDVVVEEDDGFESFVSKR
jgi:hypothetical protein